MYIINISIPGYIHFKKISKQFFGRKFTCKKIKHTYHLAQASKSTILLNFSPKSKNKDIPKRFRTL